MAGSGDGLDYSAAAVAERVRRSNAKVFAAYLAFQAVVGVGFWVALATSAGIRELFELRPSLPAVTDAWYRQPRHCSSRRVRMNELSRPWQRGHRNPCGQRTRRRYCQQLSSSGNRSWNSINVLGKRIPASSSEARITPRCVSPGH